jgi:stage V sporulation protein B
MKHFKKPFTASALMGIVVYGAHSIIQLSLTTAVSDYLGNAISTTIAVIVGVFIYLYGLALTRGITQRDLEEFPSKVTKLIPKFIRRRII